MARNRVIYQSEALYVSENAGSSSENGHEQLTRVQSANYSFTINRQDVNEFGQLARIDSIVMDAPTVGLDFTYYPTDGFNEAALGFGTGSAVQFASGHLVNSSGKNFYISTVDEGSDAVGVSGESVASVIGLGNAFLTDYSLDLSVGSLPTVSVSMECSNINSDVTLGSGANGQITGVSLPSVDITDGSVINGTAELPVAIASGESQTISALRPGDIEVNISALNSLAISNISGADEDASIHIQSASLSIPLGRSPIQRLGTRFSYARTVDFPVNATLSVNGILNEIETRNLSTIMDNADEFDVTLTLKETDGTSQAMKYELKGCKIDSESFSSSIGSNKTVDLTFSTQIGGVNDTTNGVFLTATGAALGGDVFAGS
jgi:hypothetical protein